MKETLRTEYNKTYTRENNIITIERKERLSFYEAFRWGATDVEGNVLAKVDNYTDTEINTIERMLLAEGYKVARRIADIPNLTIFEKTF